MDETKHILDLAEQAYRKNCYTFSPFLSLAEQDAFLRERKQVSHVPYRFYGGYEGSERQILRFGDEEMMGYEQPFPIVCIEIAPLMEKFADDLTHRDFLGACMNLGIERGILGDILIKGKKGYLFCVENMADYLIRELTKVKHTNVSCNIFMGEQKAVEIDKKEKMIQVSSERADLVIAKVYSLSRSQVLDFFTGKKVFIDGMLEENNSKILKSGQRITVRGRGRFEYKGCFHTTKKGNLNVRIELWE